jgi:hypothetical protein
MPSTSAVIELLRRCPPIIRVPSEGGEDGPEIAITGNTRLLLVTFALNGTPDDPSVCTLSRSELMEQTGMCKSTLDTQIHLLKQAGLLSKKKEKQKINGKWRNIWRLTTGHLKPRDDAGDKRYTDRTWQLPDFVWSEKFPYSPYREMVVIEETEKFMARLAQTVPSLIERAPLWGQEDYVIAAVKQEYPDAKFRISDRCIAVESK